MKRLLNETYGGRCLIMTFSQSACKVSRDVFLLFERWGGTTHVCYVLKQVVICGYIGLLKVDARSTGA